MKKNMKLRYDAVYRILNPKSFDYWSDVYFILIIIEIILKMSVFDNIYIINMYEVIHSRYYC